MFLTKRNFISVVITLITASFAFAEACHAQGITGYVVYEKPFNSPTSLTIDDNGLPPAPDLGNNSTQGSQNVPVYDGGGVLIGYTNRSAYMRWTEQIILTSDELSFFKSSGKKYAIRVLINGEASRFSKFPGMLYEDQAGSLKVFARIVCDAAPGSARYSKAKSESSILTDNSAKFSVFKTWDDFDVNVCAGPLRLKDAYIAANKFQLENFIVQLIEL